MAGGLAIAALALAACGSSSGTSGNGGGAATQDPTAKNNQGGKFHVGLVQEPTSFLAAGITDSMTFSYAADAPITEGLLWYRSVDETSNAKTQADFFRPDLATEVPTVANNDVKLSGCPTAAAKMCVTWKLRDGVQWQDGSKFSADDVCATVDFFWTKYGIKKATNPTAILSTSGWDQILDCTKDSSLQVTLDFKSVFGPYLSLLTGVYGVIPAKQLQAAFASNADLEKTNQTVDLTVGSGNSEAFKGTGTLDKIIVGTGPYVLKSYEPQKLISLVKNKNYWDKDHQPSIDEIDFVIEADVPAQLAAATSGELDMGLDYRLAFLAQLQTTAKAGKFSVQTIHESGAEKIDINTCGGAGKTLCGSDAKANPDLADVNLRRAMMEGINRPAIVTNIAAGATTIPDDSWLYLGAEYARSPDVNVTAYDVNKAKSDLDAAGYTVSSACHKIPGERADKNGNCLEFDFVTTSGNPARKSAQVAINQDLSALGIFTNTSLVKAGKLFGSFADGGLLYTHKFDLAMYTNTMSSPAEPDSYWPGYESSQIPSKANSGQGQNDTGLNDPVVDKAMNDGRQSVDLTVRATAYRDAESQLAKDLVEIPLYQQVTVNSYSTKLKGLQPNDLVWTFNAYDWFCTGGNCQA